MSTAVAESAASRRPRRWWRAAIGLAIAVALVLAGVGVRWWTHPRLFGSLGDSYASVPLPRAEAALSTTVIFPRVNGEEERITINGIEAVFAENTAEAHTTFSICHLTPGEDPIGAVHGAASYCQDSTTVEPGATFLYGGWPKGDYLFVTITPTRAGVSKLIQVKVTYERGPRYLYQRGTETIGIDRVVTAQ